MNSLILSLSKATPFRGDLDYHLIRAVMVFTFYIFSYQKWFSFEAHQIAPFISHSPLVFWLIPAFGIRGAAFFLGTTEALFGTLILLGFWSRRLGIVGALGSIVTFLGTVTIIPFFPNAWAPEAGGFPGDVFAGRIPNEGLPLPGGLVLPPQAGSDACGAGDSHALRSGSDTRSKTESAQGRWSWLATPMLAPSSRRRAATRLLLKRKEKAS